MPPLYAPIAMASSTPTTKPKKLLFGLVPGMRWIPHDIPSLEASLKPKSRNPFSLKTSAPDHGSMCPRKASVWIPEEGDAVGDGDGERMHAQGQSMFFARLPIELRRMVYEYIVGGEIVHLTLSTKRRFGHFICDDTSLNHQDNEVERKECACRVIVGGRKSARLDCGGVAMVRCCRRMYVPLSLPLSSPNTCLCLLWEGYKTDKDLLGTQKPSRISTAHTPSPSSI
jgi:hypothetical protein